MHRNNIKIYKIVLLTQMKDKYWLSRSFRLAKAIQLIQELIN